MAEVINLEASPRASPHVSPKASSMAAATSTKASPKASSSHSTSLYSSPQSCGGSTILSLCSRKLRFHIMLEDMQGRYVSSLGSEPYQFSTTSQRILQANGSKFSHPLEFAIWKIVVKCTSLGDGDKILVNAPIDEESGVYDLNKKPGVTGQCHLSVRIFEVDSVKVVETAAIQANLGVIRKDQKYWQYMQTAIRSEPDVLESGDEYWTEVSDYIDEKVMETEEALTAAHKYWMRPVHVVVPNQ